MAKLYHPIFKRFEMAKKRHFSGLLSIAVLVCLFYGGCQPSSRQAASWQAGDRFDLQVSMVSDMLLPLGIPKADHKVTEMRMTYEVKEAEGGMPRLVTVRIAALKASVDTMGVNCDYDSATQAQMPDYDKTDKRYRQKEEYWNFFRDVVGQQYTVRLNDAGEVAEFVEVSEKLRQAMDGLFFGSTAGDQMTFLFSESRLRQYAEAAVGGELAGNRVKGGADWQRQAVAEIPRAEAVMAARNYKVENIREESGGDIADISYEVALAEGAALPVQYPARYEKVKGKIGMKILEVSGQGQIQYGAGEGRLVKLEEKMLVRIVPAKGVAPTGKKTRENKMYYQIQTTIEYPKE